ncbi:MAG TPA: hypothetical protein VKA46_00070 [Gemmataceae bacterium]|nr:hypothetical protein [Gemmataceae bacterium]
MRNLRLVRGLYERGFSARDVRELFRILDWITICEQCRRLPARGPGSKLIQDRGTT